MISRGFAPGHRGGFEFREEIKTHGRLILFFVASFSVVVRKKTVEMEATPPPALIESSSIEYETDVPPFFGQFLV